MTAFRTLRPVLVPLFAILLTVASFGAPLAAQESTPITQDALRTISVNGTGVVSVKPDTAMVTLGVVKTDDSLKTAQDEVTQDLQEITGKLKEAGIADEDLATSQYNVRPINEYDKDGNFKGITGYEVSAALDVTVRNLDSLGDILDAATSAGANQIWGIAMYVDDTSEAANQARTAAMDDARARAETFARAEGLLITGVYSIQETAAPEPKAINMETSREMAVGGTSEDMAAQPVPISTGTTEIRVNVEVIYTIEQGNG